MFDSPIQQFWSMLHALVMSKGDPSKAAKYAKQHGTDSTVQRALELWTHGVAYTQKQAILSGTTSNPTWGGPLLAYSSLTSAFFESLRNVSILDAMLPYMQRARANSRMGVETSGAVGAEVDEGKMTPFLSLSFEQVVSEAFKVLAQAVVSGEVSDLESAAGQTMIRNGVGSAVARACNNSVLARAFQGITVHDSAGDLRSDVRTMLADVKLGALSRPLFLGSSEVVQTIALEGSPQNAPANGEVGLTSGTLLGCPILSCDELAAYAGDTNILMLTDCAQWAGDSDNVVFDVSDQASVVMSTAPADGSQPLTSVWQNGGLVIRAGRWVSLKKIRASAVSAVRGVAYGIETESP